MAKFVVSAEVTVSLHKEIEADSREEAIEKAQELGIPGLCHFCENAGLDADDEWELNGLDGEPDNLRVDE